ncbi:MAG: GTPase ObgE [Candidatus Zixiibacteriota bacterium]|nr:MAG: GTPase ObgE [candidate division Zixibacteria bacterium]
MFVDYVEIEVQAGNGGPGCVSFHTEKYIPKGGPDGGDGGHGSNIVAVADPHMTTLLDYRYHRKYKGQNGRPGSGALKTGKSGETVKLRVPVGTIFKNLDNNEIVVDLKEPGEEAELARGGRGGKGNHFFKSATNQAPRTSQPGEPGERLHLAMELKLLADVGLVGQPNAGKSTILAAFSAARPKIADYPFTTLVPNLGIVSFREYKSCVMADIPGLIKGAAEGKGLGHQFLKHIQRTRLLVYVVDCNEDNIIDTRGTLEKELEEFDETLTERPSLTVITKIDTMPESDLKEIKNKLPAEYMYLSAVSQKGSAEFLQAIERELDKQRT